jgi:hypothetical protein
MGLLRQPRLRWIAIALQGRGTPADPVAHPDAAKFAIDAGRFRQAPRNAPITDAGMPIEAYDRALSWRWLEVETHPLADNQFDPTGRLVYQVTLLNGIVYGAGHDNRLLLYPGEDLEEAETYPDERVQHDAERLRLALTFGPLFQGGTDPNIAEIEREGITRVTDLNNGRMYATTIYRVVLGRDNTRTYD